MTEFFEWRDAPRADFAVIGDPVSHSLSPRMHAAALQAMGLSLSYVAVRVPPGEVAPALEHLAGLGYRGANCTVPHKAEALAACRSADPFARRVGAVNTVRLPTLEGTNTDGPGFLDTLGPLGMPRGSRVLVLGAGGSARAVAAALEDAGYRLRLWNRTRERAEALVRELGLSADLSEHPDPSGCRLIVNTTSASLHGSEVSLDWGRVEPDAVAYDLMYGESPTPFLLRAARSGLRTLDGRPLLAAQGARSLEWWLGAQAPRRVLLLSLGCRGDELG
ncbi:MAG: shikimate dehydrogenase [Fimbriimonadales bacterium]|nr:shikimate dehydrogenase [Fimbriimonadales bacterium]